MKLLSASTSPMLTLLSALSAPEGQWVKGPGRAGPQPEGAEPRERSSGGDQGEEVVRPLEAAQHPTAREVVSECLSVQERGQGGD